MCLLDSNQKPLGFPMKNRLRVLRTDQEWSQAELARRLGVSRQTVNAVERGKYHPSLPLAFKIARLFKTAIEDVFQNELGPRREASRSNGNGSGLSATTA